MTPDQYRAALASLNLSQARLARLLGVQTTTTNRWAAGRSPIPRAVALVLHAMGRLGIEEMEGA